MKILAINGSPNTTGYTSILINIVLDVCKEAGAVCEKVNLADYNIEACKDCEKCKENRECWQDDDFLHLKASMQEADGIIIGSPYYNGKPYEQLDVLFDRLRNSGRGTDDIANKYIVGLATSASDNCKRVAKYCARLGGISLPGLNIISGLIYEKTILKTGIKDLFNDTMVKVRINEVVAKLVSDNENKHISLYKKLVHLIIGKRLTCFIRKTFRKRTGYSVRFKEEEYNFKIKAGR
jgi:multimeric flavodoxin WrbA